jgi:hypothetical protein
MSASERPDGDSTLPPSSSSRGVPSKSRVIGRVIVFGVVVLLLSALWLSCHEIQHSSDDESSQEPQ